MTYDRWKTTDPREYEREEEEQPTVLAAPPQCARDSKERVQEIIGKLAKDEPSKFLQWENDSWRTYYAGFDLTEFAMSILAALSGTPGAEQDQLSRLRQAILDNTQGDGFWIGEILLAVLAKETGFNGAVTRPNSEAREKKITRLATIAECAKVAEEFVWTIRLYAPTENINVAIGEAATIIIQQVAERISALAVARPESNSP